MANRIAVVHKEKCNPEHCSLECIKYNPHNRMGTEVIKIVDGKAWIDEELSTDADQISAKKCPFHAITMVNLPGALDEDPVHRYGHNGFALYNLPIPKPNSVVGLIGRNGIGKSTALKILAGMEVPNLSKENDTYDAVIERFKGSEAQSYFEKLKAGGMKVAFKPQQVDQIPNQVKGKVQDLLKKADERKAFTQVTEELSLTTVLDRDIKELSGGELQRVAIAAAMLKDADLYFFDEPTSFLDVKQRLKVSQVIRSLTEFASVMVVEHDLIVLDYIADYVHIFYGREAVYGVVSGVKAAKAGINTYLHGYLKEENVRFRDKAINFGNRGVQKHAAQATYHSWPAFEHAQGDFSLTSEEGEMQEHDVIGILGENGIGKTTFIKILAGEIKNDANIGLEVSYKPQYLEPSDMLVKTALPRYTKFKAMLAPFKIDALLERKLTELSGGELQRVSIAAAITKEADVYLFDEPSAYLDVEQRLQTSKIIQDFMVHHGKACIVVDHDLLFLDYLSKHMLVFEGIPAKSGSVKGPFKMETGMNHFLQSLQITFRRDPESHRPRANKKDSQMDQEQKSKKNYYA